MRTIGQMLLLYPNDSPFGILILQKSLLGETGDKKGNGAFSLQWVSSPFGFCRLGASG